MAVIPVVTEDTGTNGGLVTCPRAAAGGRPRTCWGWCGCGSQRCLPPGQGTGLAAGCTDPRANPPAGDKGQTSGASTCIFSQARHPGASSCVTGTVGLVGALTLGLPLWVWSSWSPKGQESSRGRPGGEIQPRKVTTSLEQASSSKNELITRPPSWEYPPVRLPSSGRALARMLPSGTHQSSQAR